MPIVDIFTNSCINMLPDKQSGKNPVVPDNYLFAPDNVRDRPLIFRLVVLLYLLFSLFLAYYLNALLTSCKWFVSHCIIFLYLYFIIFCFTAGAYIIMIMACANSSHEKRVGLAGT